MTETFNKRKFTRHLVEYAFVDIFSADGSPSRKSILRNYLYVRNNGCSIVGRKLRQNTRSLPQDVKDSIGSFLRSKKSIESALIGMVFLLTLDVYRKTIEDYIDNFDQIVTSNDIAAIIGGDKANISKTINNHLRKRINTRYIFVSEDVSIHLHHVGTLKNNEKTYRAVLQLQSDRDEARVLAIIISMPKMGDNLEKAVLKVISDRTEEMRLDFNPQVRRQELESGQYINVTIVRTGSVTEGQFAISKSVVRELFWDEPLGSVVL